MRVLINEEWELFRCKIKSLIRFTLNKLKCYRLASLITSNVQIERLNVLVLKRALSEGKLDCTNVVSYVLVSQSLVWEADRGIRLILLYQGSKAHIIRSELDIDVNVPAFN